MKINKIILPVVASAMLLTGCDDQIMEWGTPEGHNGVTAADLPLAVKEVLANYDDIKAYAAEHHPNMIVGLGVGKDIYMGNDGRHELAADNFQMVTWGNAMKMDAIVTSGGALNFANLDPALDKLIEDNVKLYGHNFFWHTQQQQNYLKALVAPTPESSNESNINNLLINGDFENGSINPWFGWGGASERKYSADEGADGSACVICVNPDAGNDYYTAQLMQDFSLPLENGVTYTMRFKAKSAEAGGSIQLCVQNTDHGNGSWYKQVDLTTDWVTYEFEWTCSKDDAQELCINFGKVIGTYYIDDVEFGELKAVNPDAGRVNLLKNGTFDENTDEWSRWNGVDDDVKEWDESEGNFGAGCMKIVNTQEEPGNQWKHQIHAGLTQAIPEGTTFYVSYYIKTASGTGSVRCSTTGYAHYQGDQTILSEWQRIEWKIDAAGGDIEGLNFDIAAVPNTYYIDDVVVSTDPFNSDENRASRRAIRFIPKTDEEKYDALVGAMEAWVKGMAEHLAEKGIVPVGYDVINEAIADGSGNGVRGLNGVFGGSVTDENGNVTYDSAPTEDEDNGLTLNWGSGHWYWGYYVPDYAVKAFQFARQYLPAETKLFYNDYNLETSDSKRAAAIQFVKDIDAANGSAIVDGIGTQMHITLSGTSDDLENNANKVAELRAKLDKQFQELAATGKLIRVTELDITLGTGSPSAAQYQAQSDAYRAVFESYLENVPEAQQSGITIWSLTDADDEHEYWLSGEVPNLWDKEFKRKWAYKGVCDGLAGEDLGLKYGGEDYKAFYEKNNVSETVK